MPLLWGPDNISYGIGFISCPDDLVIHVYKLNLDRRRNTHKLPYHWRVERRGAWSGTVYDSAIDSFEHGGQDFREAKMLAEIWHTKYLMRQAK